MNQPRLVALIATAFVLYVVASAGAAGMAFSPGVLALAVVGVWGGLAPLWLRRGEPPQAPAQVGAMGGLLALCIGAWLAFSGRPLLGELVSAAALPFFGGLTVRLALFAPDTPPRLVRHVYSEQPVRVLGLIAALWGVAAALPPVWILGRPLIAPHWWSRAPIAFGLACAVIAIVLRAFRRRLGSTARALAANLWALLGCVCALALLSLALVGRGLEWIGPSSVQISVALAAALFLLGHVWLVSPTRALVASAWARELFASALALAFALALLGLHAAFGQPDVLLRLVVGASAIVTFVLARRVLRRLTRLLLAPQRGQLLDAIDTVSRELLGAPSYAELAARVLRPLRRASGSPEAAPLLVSLHPPRELRLDAAGLPRVVERSLPTALKRALEDSAGEPLVRADLRARLVRRPELRELLAALDDLDALCVVPLCLDFEVEGALVVACGARSQPLTLEELAALVELARVLAPLAAGFWASERASRRADEAQQARNELRAQLEERDEELAQLQARVNLLKAGRDVGSSAREPVQYSEAMRELRGRLASAAAQDMPLLLVSEPGIPLAPLAELIHRESGRGSGPLVVGDCAGLEPELSLRTLFGSADRQSARPGWLELASEGTLLLLDLPALGLDAQQALAEALAERRARAVGSLGHYAVTARIVVSSRLPLAALLATGALAPELGRWLETTGYRVPPLRERREDLESLVLIAIDRAARVLGREVPGIEPDGLAALVACEWPGNVLELESVLERAVAKCKSTRVQLSDLPPLSTGSVVAGSFVDQEREILRRALERAGGNKTRAARALGLKRTTLIDKLRRLGLETPGAHGAEH